MSSIRTQLYLTREQRRDLDARARREGKTMASVIRDAVDRYLESEPLPMNEALRSTFGRLPDLDVPWRGEWDRGNG